MPLRESKGAARSDRMKYAAQACDTAWGCSPTRVKTTVSGSSVFRAAERLSGVDALPRPSLDVANRMHGSLGCRAVRGRSDVRGVLLFRRLLRALSALRGSTGLAGPHLLSNDWTVGPSRRDRRRLVGGVRRTRHLIFPPAGVRRAAGQGQTWYESQSHGSRGAAFPRSSLSHCSLPFRRSRARWSWPSCRERCSTKRASRSRA